MPRRLTIRDIHEAARSRKLSMVTAYDAFSARLVDESGVDMALVGDSLGTTVQGRPDTLGVTMADMLYHTGIVARCSSRALVVGDMPFGSYQASRARAMENAMAFLRAGAQAVKLEGGKRVLPLVKRMVEAGVPVMGHLGFTPQSTNQTGGPRVNKARDTLLKDALALEKAGVFALVLEMVPAEITKEISKALTVPTIGIGAGPHADGQVLVFYDMLGFSPEFTPRFLKRYFDFHNGALGALKAYKADVEAGSYPGPEHSY